MKLHVGTSGYSYKEWKGNFYPEDLPAKEMLSYYSQRLPAVEINNTFYRLPQPGMIQNWKEQVPEDFRFSIKASQRITHIKRMNNNDEKELLEWMKRVKAQKWNDAFILFKHEDEGVGPKLDARFLELAKTN